MSDDDLKAWATASAAMQGLTIAEHQWPGVLENLKRTQAIAAGLLALDLPDDLEPAPVYRP
jgi:hypothetical protein